MKYLPPPFIPKIQGKWFRDFANRSLRLALIDFCRALAHAIFVLKISSQRETQ